MVVTVQAVNHSRAVSSPSPSESLLVFSDVHLGSDIQEIPNGAATKARRSASVDRDLVRLLAHYRAQKPPADRWRIVIAGDFIDFIGMTVAPNHPDALDTELTDEERWHGVGSAADHARLKLARVAERHADVFAALGAFVGDGHALSLVHGNHDIEFHWDEVKDDFRAALFAHVAVTSPYASTSAQAVAFAERIEFNPWFFYRDGVAYIEHGHQYDSFCATAHIMSPLSPLDPRRVARGFSDILLRYVVRPTRGMKEHGHENVGLGHYLAFGAQLGVSGMARLGLNFAHAVAELFRVRRAHLSEAALALRAEHEERVAKLAAATRLGVGRLRALLSLQATPITSTVAGIMRGVLLDRLAVAVVAVPLLLVLAVVGGLHGPAPWAAGGVVLAWTLLHFYLSRQRTIDPTEHLVDRAAHLAKLFPAAFVVMGHTHVPAAVRAGPATYINVGSWAEEAPDAADSSEPEDGEYRAPRTHLVIHVRDERPEARFCTWGERGPEELSVDGCLAHRDAARAT
jgi:UDP-2,3-diacylglucosamine pyrophosphatase LpxH